MRDRRSAGLLAAGLLALLVLLGSCASGAAAARAGAMPMFDWQIPLGSYRALVVHNGPTTECHPFSLRESCHQQVVRYDFYIHYITPEADRTLLWFVTTPPR